MPLWLRHHRPLWLRHHRRRRRRRRQCHGCTATAAATTVTLCFPLLMALPLLLIDLIAPRRPRCWLWVLAHQVLPVRLMMLWLLVRLRLKLRRWLVLLCRLLPREVRHGAGTTRGAGGIFAATTPAPARHASCHASLVIACSEHLWAHVGPRHRAVSPRRYLLSLQSRMSAKPEGRHSRHGLDRELLTSVSVVSEECGLAVACPRGCRCTHTLAHPQPHTLCVCALERQRRWRQRECIGSSREAERRRERGHPGEGGWLAW